MAKPNFTPASDLLIKTLSIAERAKRTPTPKYENSTSKQKTTPHSNVVQLPLWPEPVRYVPNAILRSALFTVSQRRTVAQRRELLAAVDGIEVRFKGERFNQTDLDVWEMLLHLARSQPLGDRVEFSAHALLKELHRSTGKSQREQLKEEIARLGGGWIEITWTKEQKTFLGGLIEKAFRDEETQRYVIVFSKEILSLYNSGYSNINWSQRQALGSNNLAKWLHGFYATHATPFPYKVETLKRLCGSFNGSLRDFRRSLRVALDDLLNIDAVNKWVIDKNDLVHVEKHHSISEK